MIKKLFKNSMYGMIGNLVTLLIGLFFAGMTIRYLGAARAGFFILASAILGWVQLAGGGAFHAPAVRQIAHFLGVEDKTPSRDVVKTVSTANILTGVPFVIATICAFPILFSWSKLDSEFKGEAFTVVLLGSLGFLLDQYSGALKVVYEGLQRFDLQAITKVTTGLFSNIARLVSLVIFKNMEALAITNFLLTITSTLVDVILVYRLIGGGVLPGWKRGILKNYLSFGVWTWLGNTGNILFFNFTSLILAKHVGSAALMYVSLPQSIILAIGQFIIASSYFIFPTLSGYKELTFDVINNVEDRFRWFIGLISFSVFTGLLLFAPSLLRLLVDAKYAEHAGLVLSILCIYGIVWSQEIFNVFSTMAVGHSEANTITNLVTGVVTILLAVLLIPRIGYIGYPIAQMVKLPAVIWHTYWCRKILKLNLSTKVAFSAYLSPLLGALIWSLLYVFFDRLFLGNLLAQILALGTGFILFIVTIIVVEKSMFRNMNRLKSLSSMIDIALGKTFPAFTFKVINLLK